MAHTQEISFGRYNLAIRNKNARLMITTRLSANEKISWVINNFFPPVGFLLVFINLTVVPMLGLFLKKERLSARPMARSRLIKGKRESHDRKWKRIVDEIRFLSFLQWALEPPIFSFLWWGSRVAHLRKWKMKSNPCLLHVINQKKKKGNLDPEGKIDHWFPFFFNWS